MKALLANGSPNAQGYTFTTLNEVAETLSKEGIETQIFQLGKKPISGCIDCFKCQQEPGRCVINDIVNVFVDCRWSAVP